MVSKLDKATQYIEFGLSAASIIPGVNILAAIGSAKLGTIQAVGGFAYAVFKSGSSHFQTGVKAAESRAHAWKGLEYVRHGLANLVKAPFQAIGGGLIIFPAYDLARMLGIHNRRVVNFTDINTYRKQTYCFC